MALVAEGMRREAEVKQKPRRRDEGWTRGLLGTSIRKAGRGARELRRLAKTNRWTAMNGGQGHESPGRDSPETQASAHWSVMGNHGVMAQGAKKEPETLQPQAA